MLMISSSRPVAPAARAADRGARPGDAETPHAAEAVDPGQAAAAHPDRRRRKRRRAEDAEFTIEREQERAAAGGGRAARSYAPLIAQLIATRLGVAQTRERRRGSMADAVEAYRRTKISTDEPLLAPVDASEPA